MEGKTVIAQISDLHVGEYYFSEDLLEMAIEEVNALEPDMVVVSGDLTNMGLVGEYEKARMYIDRIKCKKVYCIPGNHDSRNVGAVHFEDYFGARHHVDRHDGMVIVFADSSIPDSNEGQIGRGHYKWIVDQFSDPKDFKVFVLHHHLISIPDAGRERNTVHDAGDILRILVQQEVDLVICGHKHIPYVWHFEGMKVANAGAVSSLRQRGYAKASYNIIEIHDGKADIYVKVVGGERKLHS